jgi:hypothetical protein
MEQKRTDGTHLTTVGLLRMSRRILTRAPNTDARPLRQTAGLDVRRELSRREMGAEAGDDSKKGWECNSGRPYETLYFCNLASIDPRQYDVGYGRAAVRAQQ